jgi:photosystem II stability/assembly factor-like uncharacterized protein
LDESSALLALASSVSEQRPCLLVGTTGGLQQSNDGGQTWRQALAAGVTSIVFSPQFDEDGRIWVGTDSGELLVSQDGALDWTHLVPPQPGVPLVALAVRPGRSSAEILLAATLEISERRVNVWRSSDGGQTWEPWMQEAVDWPSVHLVLSGQTPGRAVVCIDRICWQAVPPDWQPARCVETDRPIVRMSQATEPPEIVLLAPGQMLCSGDGLSWSALDGGLGDWDWVDVNLAPSTASHHIAYALSRGGVVWCRAIPKGPYRLEQKEMP